jgi:ADP-L-glycero-D-manno-heptose 6-epimerase
MKILITGYKGFIGQNMVNALKDEHELKLFEWGDPIPDLKGFDWCIHLGAISSTTETDVAKVLEQNYDFSRFLVNQCQSEGVNFQYSSSASIYGNGTEFLESSPAQPQSPYAWSKYLFERYAEGFKNRWTIRVQGFRYFNVYGPYEDHKGTQASPHHQFKKQAETTGVIKIFEGSENFKRDFVSVDHVINTHKTFFSVTETGIWNVGTGNPTSFKSVADTIADQFNAKIEYIPMPDNLKGQYQTYTCAELSKLNGTIHASNG